MRKSIEEKIKQYPDADKTTRHEILASLGNMDAVEATALFKEQIQKAPDKETVNALRSIIKGVEGVEGLSWVKCRKMGRGLLVDAAIEVLGCIKVEEGHEISDEVKFAIMARYPEVADVVIHTNPNYCATCDADKLEK